MSGKSITLLRLSVSLLMFAVKGNQDGIVQQQIETIGLRPWLSLVTVWIAERIFTEVARFRDFVAPEFQALPLKPNTVRIAVPAPIYLF